MGNVGVWGPFDPLALLLRFLYSFSETDFFVDEGVVFLDSVGGGDLRTLGGGEPLDESVEGSSRLRF